MPAQSPQSIRLHLLGPLELIGADGASVTSVLVHPKRLALLSYLAAGGAGRFHRRDTLVGLLWPEASDEHARAALRKAIYHLRRSLGEQTILSRGDDDVALADHVWCDAAELERALAAGDHARAFELYRGPLLAGFFVPDAPQFEDWLERERARMRHLAFSAAWHMADAEEKRGDRFASAHWGRQALAIVPDDEAALRRLLELLDRLGDRAGAIAAYDDFARRLAADYDVEPSDETRRLVKAIAAGDGRQATGDGRQATGEGRQATGDGAQGRADIGGLGVAVGHPAGRAQAAGRSLRAALPPRRVLIAASFALVLLLGATSVLREAVSDREVSANLVAVFPFEYRGGAELAYLRDGMAGLLATGLDGAGELRALDPQALPDGAGTAVLRDPARARETARELGAGLYVLGDVVQAGSSVRITASLYEGGAREPVRAAVSGEAGQLFALVDELAARLLANRAEQAGSLVRIASRTTRSLPALKAYLEGEAFFRSGHYREAVSAYQQAIAQDSTFALAYYRLAASYSWSSDTLARPTAQLALRHADRLAPVDRLLVEALIPYLEGDASEAERRYRAILSTYPYEAEAWYPLGEVLFHYNPARGRPIGEARAPFEFALRLGPRDAPLTHLLEIVAIEGNYVAFDSLLGRIDRGSHFDVVGRTVRALVSGTEAERVAVLDEVAGLSDADLGNSARHMLFLVDDNAAAARVPRLLTDAARPAEVQALGRILLAHIEAGAGRPRAAAAQLDAAAALDPIRALEHRALLLSLPFLPASGGDVADTRDALARLDARAVRESGVVFPGDRGMHGVFRAYLRGLLSARFGDTTAARARATETLRLGATLSPEQVGDRHARALAADLARGIGARIAWERGDHADALAALQPSYIERAGASLLGVVPFHSQPHERWLRAESLREEGRLEEALGWYASFEEHAPWGRAFRAMAHLRRAEVHEALGEDDLAGHHYARFIDWWRDAEPELQPLVESARVRLRQLSPGEE